MKRRGVYGIMCISNGKNLCAALSAPKERSMILQNLCAGHWTNYLLDGVLALVLLGYMIYCGKRGFIDCFFSFFSTIVALLAAIFLAKVLLNMTGGLFGLRGAMDKSFTNAFMKVDGFDTHVVGESTEATLKSKHLPMILVQLVLKMTKGAHEGTILAEALGDVTASLAATIICGILLFVVAKLLMRLAKGGLEKLADKLKIVGAVNTILGCLVGVLGFTLLVSAVLAILGIIPIQAINNAFNKSVLVGFIYKYNPVMWLIGLVL